MYFPFISWILAVPSFWKIPFYLLKEIAFGRENQAWVNKFYHGANFSCKDQISHAFGFPLYRVLFIVGLRSRHFWIASAHLPV